jgi:hypothetical protein
MIPGAPAWPKRAISSLTVSGLSPRSLAMATALWPRLALWKMTCLWGTETARPIRGLLADGQECGPISHPIRP